MTDLLNVPIILASTSPRRIEIMNQVQLTVQVIAPDADESPRRRESPRAMVARLSREKAESIAPMALRHYGSAVIVAADTVVVAPNGKTIFGKPRSIAEASKMLGTLAGRTHTVLTGYCMLEVARAYSPKQIVRVVQSRVKMRPLSKSVIQRYIASGEPMDKAGAYAAQGLGTALIQSINGSYANVVGLPIADLLIDFEKEFKVPLFSWFSPRTKK